MQVFTEYALALSEQEQGEQTRHLQNEIEVGLSGFVPACSFAALAAARVAPDLCASPVDGVGPHPHSVECGAAAASAAGGV